MPSVIPCAGETILGLDPGALLSRGLYRRDSGPSEETGERLGDYQLLRPIARGGMGVVYEARQISLQRIVAVKMISSGLLATDAEVKRFRREAEAAASLDHPGIVPIYEIGEDSGQHYFSMKLVEGGSLADLSAAVSPEERRSPAWARRAATLVSQMARAVHHAHRRGVLHRDVKPTNVLIGENGTPLLTDFGLAKLTERDPGVTLSMMVMGTPGYMSPEQASGRAAGVTPATDIYGLGAVLYDLLQGSTPFTGGSTLEILRMVQERPPPPLRKDNPALSRDLETICLRCLQKEPARRFVSAEDLAADLDRWLAGQPILARSVSLPERAWLWCRRNPAAALAGVLLLTLAVVSTVSAIRLSGQRSEINETLHAALLTQAHAQRTGTQPGRRAECLAAMEKAAAIHPSLAVRNEVIAALALTDFAPPEYWYRQPKSGPSLPEVRLSAAGDRIAVLDPGGSIAVHDRTTGSVILRLATPPQTIAMGEFSPDGRWLIAWDAGHNVFVWDLHRTGPAPVPHLHALPVPCDFAADFTPDSRSLALAARDGSFHFFDLLSGAGNHRFTLPAQVSRFFFSPAGDRIAAESGKVLLVWNVRPPREISRHEHSEFLSDITWHPGGCVLAASYHNGEMQIFDTDRHRTRWLPGHLQYVNALRFDPDGAFVVSTSWDGTQHFTDPATGHLLTEARATGSVRSVRDGHYVANFDDYQHLLVRKVLRSPILRTFTSPAAGYPGFSGVSFSEDGRWLASGEFGGLHVWRVADGREAAYVPSASATRPRFHPDGRHIISGGKGHIIVWPFTADDSSLTVGNPLPPVSVGPVAYPTVDFTPDGLHLVSGGSPGPHVFTWPNTTTPHIIQEKDRPAFVHNTIAVSPDGAWIAGGSVGGAGVTVFSTRDGTLLQNPVHNENAGVAISPDGRTLATATAAELVLWDTTTWKPRHRLPTGLIDTVQLPVAWSPDGSLLAIPLTRREIHLLDPATAATLAILTPPHPVNLVSLAWSRDSRHLAAQTLGPVLQLWDIPALRKELHTRGLDW